MRQGDFTELALQYSKNRPDYSQTVLNSLIGILSKPLKSIDFVDVGAGTGIWSRMVSIMGVNSSIAIEPNKEMRKIGIRDCKKIPIKWLEGSAESTGLKTNSVDWLTMASSFHWTDFDKSTKEFHRLLRHGGIFTALWNPRLIEVNPMLIAIEEHLNELRPNLKRVSSGMSGITEKLTQKLWDSKLFEDVVYSEGRHVIKMSKERYIGAWKSVNDLQSQLGTEKFKNFIEFIELKIKNENYIEATYLTRSWSAKKKIN